MILAQAAETAQPTFITQALPFAVLAVLFYFFMIRPQRRRTAAAQTLRDSVAVGNEIRTIGGIHGMVLSIGEKEVVIEVEGGTKLKIERRAVGVIVEPTEEQGKA